MFLAASPLLRVLGFISAAKTNPYLEMVVVLDFEVLGDGGLQDKGCACNHGTSSLSLLLMCDCVQRNRGTKFGRAAVATNNCARTSTA